jgi:UrcA family protein
VPQDRVDANPQCLTTTKPFLAGAALAGRATEHQLILPNNALGPFLRMIGNAMEDFKMNRYVTAYAVITAAALYSSTAAAEEAQIIARGEPQNVTRNVSYADIDLTIDREVHRLQKRVWSAADDVCDELYRHNPYADGEKDICQRKAYRGAKPQIAAAVKWSQGGALAEGKARRDVVVAAR